MLTNKVERKLLLIPTQINIGVSFRQIINRYIYLIIYLDKLY